LRGSVLDVDDLEPALDGLDEDEVTSVFFFLLPEDLVGRVVRGHIEPLVGKRDLGTLDLSCAAPAVCPDLEVVADAGTLKIEIIDQYGLLTSVAIPPLVLGLKVERWLNLSDQVALTNTWRAHEPDALDVFCGTGLEHGLLARSQALLEVGCFKSQRWILVEKILEGSTLLEHELTEILTVSLLRIELLLPVDLTFLDEVAVLLDVLRDSGDVSGLLVVAMMAVEVPELLVAAVEPLVKEHIGMDVRRSILVELTTDHHALIWLTSQLVLEEVESLLFALVELGVGEEPTLRVDIEFFCLLLASASFPLDFHLDYYYKNLGFK